MILDVQPFPNPHTPENADMKPHHANSSDASWCRGSKRKNARCVLPVQLFQYLKSNLGFHVFRLIKSTQATWWTTVGRTLGAIGRNIEKALVLA